MADSQRYARQTRFAPLGSEGQAKLAAASVAVVGCGALGTTALSLLARAGCGHLRLIDRDIVEWSNLPRQTLFTEDDAAQNELKAIAAARHLQRANQEIRLEPQVADLSPANIDELLDGIHLVIDATDNFATRYLINDYCVSQQIPWIYGAAVGSYGLAFPVLPGLGPCLCCLYPHPPSGVQPTCETAGVLNTIPSLVASWQVAWATRLLAGGEPAAPTLTTFDSWHFTTRQVSISRDPACDCCVHGNHPYLDGERRAPISLCGRDAVQIHDRNGALNLTSLAGQLSGMGEIRSNEFALRFVPAGGESFQEMIIFPDGRAIIKGTTDPATARSAYAKFIGR
jgi:adenylyltransferase/sulfurtransferase